MESTRQPEPPAAGTRRRIRRPVLVAAAIALGLVIALVADVARSGTPERWLARHGLGALTFATYDAAGTRFDVDGRELYLDCRGSGSPTIVLVAGMGSGAESWAPVLDDLAGLTRTCAYDRPGIGRSSPGRTADLAAAAADLRALLAAAGEQPPFVLVGHSLGAAIARVAADADHDRVAGIALVDGFEPDVFAAAVAPLLGSLRDEYLDREAGLWAAITATEGIDGDRSLPQLLAADLAGLPVEVLRAPRQEPRLDAATNERIRAAQRAAYEALSPGLVRYTIADGAGHIVQADRPDLVVESVRRLVEAARATR